MRVMQARQLLEEIETLARTRRKDITKANIPTVRTLQTIKRKLQELKS